MKKKPSKINLKPVKKDILKSVVTDVTKDAFKSQLEFNKAVKKARHRAAEKALKNVKNELTWIQSDPSGEILMDFNGKRFYITEGEMVSL
jgi:hypothetical protein